MEKPLHRYAVPLPFQGNVVNLRIAWRRIAPHQSAALRGTASASFPQGKPDRCDGDEGMLNGTRQQPAPLPSLGGRWREAPDEGRPR